MDERVANGIKLTEKGLKLYRDGKYTRAAHFLLSACIVHQYYAGVAELTDIYRRNPDNLEEAVHWCIIAAENGNSDVYSYLMTIDEQLFEKQNKIEIIVKHWKN